MITGASRSSLAVSVVVFAAIAVALLAMRAANDILSPVLLAMVLAISAAPLLHWFLKKGAPTWLAMTMTIVVFVGLVLGVVGLVSLSVQDFGDKLPEYELRLRELEHA